MSEDYGWGMDKEDPMLVVITHKGKRLFSIFLGEAMEHAGRARVMKHVRECDSSPWLKKWQEEAMEEGVRILKGK